MQKDELNNLVNEKLRIIQRQNLKLIASVPFFMTPVFQKLKLKE